MFRCKIEDMKKSILLFLLFFIFQVSVGQMFVNPVGGETNSFIYNDGSNYYLLGVVENKIIIRKSSTLEGLRSVPPKTIFSKDEGGPSHGYAAPELHRFDGKWYIYYTANRTFSSTQDIDCPRIFVIENSSDDPTTLNWVSVGDTYTEGCQSMSGLMHGAVNVFWATDASVFELNGKRYMIWSGTPYAFESKPQKIFIQEMSNPWTVIGNRVIISNPELSWEQNDVNESPQIIQRNGKVFMIYSTGSCWMSEYALGMCSMDGNRNPLNRASWTKSSTPVFEQKPASDTYGPGYFSLFKSPDGTEDWFAYDATPDSGGDCDSTRTMRIQRLFWLPNGEPYFGIPITPGLWQLGPSGEKNLPSNVSIENGLYKIGIKSTGQFLNLNGGMLDSQIDIKQHPPTNEDHQRWYVQYTNDGYYTISSRKNGLFLEVRNNKTNGTDVTVGKPLGIDGQKWKIIQLEDGSFKLESKYIQGKVLGINQETNSAELYLWTGDDNQKFLLKKDEKNIPFGGANEIVSVKSGKVIDLPSCNANNIGLQQHDRLYNICQKWIFEELDDGCFRIVSVSSGKVITVPEVPELGIKVIQSDWIDVDYQKWKLIYAGGNKYQIISKSCGWALDVSGGSEDNNAEITVYPNWGGKNQLWYLDGVYGIINKKSGKAIEVPSCTFAPVFLQQSEWLDIDCQKWELQNLGTGNYKIVSISSQKVFDLPDCSSQTGTKIRQNDDLNSECQRWRLQFVNDSCFQIVSTSSELALQPVEGSVISNTMLEQQPLVYNNEAQLWILKPVRLQVNTVIKQIWNSKIIIYPNPTHSQLNISGLDKNSESTINLIDITGKILLHNKVRDESTLLNMIGLPIGLYFVKIESKEKSIIFKINKY